MRGHKRSFVVEVRRAPGRSSSAKSASSFILSDPPFLVTPSKPVQPHTDLFQTKADQLPNHQKTGRILQALDQLLPSFEGADTSLPPKKQPQPQGQVVNQNHDPSDAEPIQAEVKDSQPWAMQSKVRVKAELADTAPLASNQKRRRHSKILARYVFGTLPLRGERWKLRLRFI